jgi:hypothetical protein
LRATTRFASLAIAVGCLGGCLPYRGDAPRDPARADRGKPDGGGGVAYPSVRRDVLDGRTFRVEVGENGKVIALDQLRFAHGRLESNLLQERLSTFAPYEVEGGDDEEIRFTAKSIEGDVTTEWAGTVWHDRIAGTTRTTEPGKAPIWLTFGTAEHTPSAK